LKELPREASVLDRIVVDDFLTEKFSELEVTIPKGINKEELVETFCAYVEADLYDWLEDNYKNFFIAGWADAPDWKPIKKRITRLFPVRKKRSRKTPTRRAGHA